MFFVGVAGGSGSGKTTFAQKVIDRVPRGAQSIVVLPMDCYYLSPLPDFLRVDGQTNFDHPQAFDWEFLSRHIEALRKGEAIKVPVYDYRHQRRTTEVVAQGPAKAVILEGIFALFEAEVRAQLDVRVYLHVDADIRFIRRLHRDVQDRGRSMDSVIRQYYDTVRPMYHLYLEPTRRFADLIVGEETDIAADFVAARLDQIVNRTTAPKGRKA